MPKKQLWKVLWLNIGCYPVLSGICPLKKLATCLKKVHSNCSVKFDGVIQQINAVRLAVSLINTTLGVIAGSGDVNTVEIILVPPQKQYGLTESYHSKIFCTCCSTLLQARKEFLHQIYAGNAMLVLKLLLFSATKYGRQYQGLSIRNCFLERFTLMEVTLEESHEAGNSGIRLSLKLLLKK